MVLDELAASQHLAAVWSGSRVELTAQPHHVHEVFGVLGRQGWKPALAHLSEKLIHIVGSEGWIQGTHFIEDAPQAPNIALVVVGLVLPNFGTGVVWCTGLCL